MTGSRVHAFFDLRSGETTGQGLDAIFRSIRALSEEEGTGLESVRLLLDAGDFERVGDRLPPEWIVSVEADPVAEANRAMIAAAESGADWLVSRSTTAPTRRSLLSLSRALDRDPFFAFATPRISLYGEELVAKLDDRFGDPTLAAIPSSAIDAMPESYLIADQLGAAVLVDARVVRDFESLSDEYVTLWGAMRDLVARARRVGFRCIVANRAVVSLPDEVPPEAGRRDDEARLHELYPEVPGLEEEWRYWSQHEYESLLGRCTSASPELRKTLLLDLTDLGSIFNGTSEAVVGLLWGLQASRTDWSISLLVSPEVAVFHGLDRYFPEFERVWPAPEGRFTAVFRPIQPWSLSQIERLHGMGLFVFVMMFDTILNETRVGAPLGLDKVWEHLTEVADGLFYISRYTRDRVRTRFPVHESVQECVALLSTHPGDYCDEPTSGDDGFVFVVGNDYPHKWMRPTIKDLVEAFPYQSFRTLGFEAPDIPQLAGLESGETDQSDVDALYARARLIVYPSQYEGFGLPVIRGLAHGKTVIARRSELLLEQAASYRGPGRLLAFETRTELVELVARVLHGLDVEPLPLGSELAPSAAPSSQIDIATRILSSIEGRVDKPLSSNWRRRQALYEMAALYGATRQE